MKPHKPTPPETTPTPLVPILVIATVVVIAAVLIGMSYQQKAISTQRQTIQNLKCDVHVLQAALQEAKKEKDFWFGLVEPDLKATNRTRWVWIEDMNHCRTGWTNHFQYPAKFMKP